ncbi:MAG TPA: YegS/Rv2252/BmrU family lipid kinase [Stellaceae bacterium]|nr:YegS/Rv2252/BmrU family lipid kinase [Stellaceae bacterium]
MLRHRVLIILNPAAGRSGSSRRRLDRVIAALERQGCAVVLRQAGPTKGDVERLAREAEADFEIVVAAGGDGTLNAVVNGMAAAPRTVGLVPLGTANVLAHDLGLPRDPERLAVLIAEGPARPIWPGRVAGRLFLTMASSGFDAETVAAVNPRLIQHLGRVAFAWAIMVCLWRYRACALSIRIDDIEHRAATVIAAKGRCYAGPYLIAPRADLAEPMLDLVLLHRSGRFAVLRYLATLLLGRVAQCRDITVLRARAASVSAAAAVPVQADGEIVARLPVLIGIADAPLLMVRP